MAVACRGRRSRRQRRHHSVRPGRSPRRPVIRARTRHAARHPCRFQRDQCEGRHSRPQASVSLSRDDGYDPDRSVVQTKRLIEEDNVFALIGAVGTPTAVATVPISNARGVPYIGPFTGAEFLRNPALTSVVNIRASYSAEAEAWVKHLTEDLHFTNIAIFYQDDAFGRDGLAGVKHALEKRGLELSAEGTFERNTRAVGARAADAQARGAAGRGDGRNLWTVRRVHQARAQVRLPSDLRQHLVRRRQRAGARTRPGRRRASSSPRWCRFRGTSR